MSCDVLYLQFDDQQNRPTMSLRNSTMHCFLRCWKKRKRQKIYSPSSLRSVLSSSPFLPVEMLRFSKGAGVMSAIEPKIAFIESKGWPWIRNDEKFVEKYRLHHTFHAGSNFSCHQHIQSHYKVYQERCKEKNLHENQHAVPRDLLCAREKEKWEKKASQRNLDEMFQKAEKPKEFSRDNILKAVAEFAVCDYPVHGFKLTMMMISNSCMALQSLCMANKAIFRNCLIAMHPTATNADLPSTHNVVTYVHKEFISFFTTLKTRINVSWFSWLLLIKW